jgi:CHAD domain-containing protein
LDGGSAAPGLGERPLRRRDRELPALVGFRRVLRPVVGTVDATWDLVLADVDPEDLHDLRVALRRSRTLVEAGRRVLPRRLRQELTRELAWLARSTGPTRDLDVQLEQLGGTSSEPSGLAGDDGRLLRLREERARVRRELDLVLRSDRAALLRAGIRSWTAFPDAWATGGRLAAEPVGAVASVRLRAAHGVVRRDLQQVGRTEAAEDLHRLRRDAKRLRYLLEAFGGLGGRRRRAEALTELRVLQDVLGVHQDAVVQAARVGSLDAEARLRTARIEAVAVAATFACSPVHELLAELVRRSATRSG